MEKYDNDSYQNEKPRGTLSGCLAWLVYLGFGVGIILAIMLSCRIFTTEDVPVPIYYSILYAVFNIIFIFTAVNTYIAFRQGKEEGMTLSSITIALGFTSGLIPVMVGYFYGLQLVVWFVLWFAVWARSFTRMKLRLVPNTLKLLAGIAGAIFIACVCIALIADDKSQSADSPEYEENPYEEVELPYTLPDLEEYNDSID